MSRFDLIAVQEVKSNLDHFERIVGHMGPGYDWIVNDVAGNNERLAFVFKKRKVKTGRLFAEIAIPEKDFPSQTVVVPYKVKKQQRVDVFYHLRFTPFDRNPYIGTFEAGAFSFTLVNVHLYYGSFKEAKKVAERAKYARRVLEIYMLGKWAASRAKRSTTYDRDIILLGVISDKEERDRIIAHAQSAAENNRVIPYLYHQEIAGPKPRVMSAKLATQPKESAPAPKPVVKKRKIKQKPKPLVVKAKEPARQEPQSIAENRPKPPEVIHGRVLGL